MRSKAARLRTSTFQLSSDAIESNALARASRASSTVRGSVPNLPAISAHATSNASLIAFKASGPNDTPSEQDPDFVRVTQWYGAITGVQR